MQIYWEDKSGAQSKTTVKVSSPRDTETRRPPVEGTRAGDPDINGHQMR